MDKIRKIDVLGQVPSLFFNSSPRYKTVLGGILSFCTVSMSLALVMYFSLRVFSRANVFIVESKEFNPSQEIDLSDYNQLFKVTKRDGTLFSLEEEERLFSFNLLFFYTAEDGNPKQTIESYPMEPCTQAHLGKHIDLYKELDDISRYHCFPLDFKLKLFGIYGGNKKFSGTYGAVGMCQGPECYTEEQIIPKIEDFYVNFAYIDYNIQSDNINTPGVPYLKQDRIQAGTRYLKRLFYELNIVEYVTDFGFVFTSTVSNDFFTMSNYSINQSERSRGNFIVTTFSIARNKVTVKRSFEKLQQVLSNIGGAIKALTISFQLTLSLVYGNFYNDSLISLTERRIKSKAAENQFIYGKNASMVEIKKTKTERTKLNWTTNLKTISYFWADKTTDRFKNRVSLLKEILSIESLVRTQVELSNLKDVIFSKEGKTVFELIGLYPKRKMHPNAALDALKKKNRNRLEEKLISMLQDRN